MKWSRADLIHIAEMPMKFSEKLNFDANAFESFDRINGLKDVYVDGTGYFENISQRFHVDLRIEGIMIVPCAVSCEDIDVPFEIETEEEFSFEPCDDEEVHVIKKEILDLNPLIFQLILSQVPLKVVKEGIEYPKGDGWEVLKEEDYIKSKSQVMDPRLEKLKEFKIQDD